MAAQIAAVTGCQHEALRQYFVIGTHKELFTKKTFKDSKNKSYQVKKIYHIMALDHLRGCMRTLDFRLPILYGPQEELQRLPPTRALRFGRRQSTG